MKTDYLGDKQVQFNELKLLKITPDKVSNTMADPRTKGTSHLRVKTMSKAPTPENELNLKFKRPLKDSFHQPSSSFGDSNQLKESQYLRV
jgi:hypothetical protein